MLKIVPAFDILTVGTAKNRVDFLADLDPSITILNARTHNLQGVSVSIPHRQLTVVTGVSGSGKSSLVFDTLFAEGQRQYVSTLSATTRQLVDLLPRPPIDSIRGLLPTLCLEQRSHASSRRSTVATLTDIYDFLRLLLAKVGTPLCYNCRSPIQLQSVEEIVDAIMSYPDGTKLTVMAPVVRGKTGSHFEALTTIQKAGLVKIRIDGKLIDLEEPPELAPYKPHSIDAVCDRIVLRRESRARLDAAVQLAIKLSEGIVTVEIAEPTNRGAIEPPPPIERLFSTKYACAHCGISFAEIEPRIFSFNSPYGACQACKGLGAIVDDATRDAKPGHDSESIDDKDKDAIVCPSCNGGRLRAESRSIFLGEKSIDQIVKMSIQEGLDWFHKLSLSGLQQTIAEPIIKEIVSRLGFLDRVGVGYLSLDRSAATLSGGEHQRVRLASSLGANLIDVCYILDEPSIGLHPNDTRKLIETLIDLRNQGNTLVVVEHDDEVMLAADHLIDIGPMAGSHGGRLLFSGKPSEIAKVDESLTGKHLANLSDPHAFDLRLGNPGVPQASSKVSQVAISERLNAGDQDSGQHNKKAHLRIRKARLNNLQNMDVTIPLQCFVGVTGVSGSGKSTLIFDTLIPAMKNHLNKKTVSLVRGCDGIDGLEHVAKVIEVDQRPVGRSSRSTPATFLGIWDEIRDVFASTRDAKQRGYTAARFGFNSGSGRCDLCQGQGDRTIAMGFLGMTVTPCYRCHGSRFNRATLQVRYREKTIADILRMSVAESLEFFQNFSRLSKTLSCLKDVGLGYLLLGQPSQTLSGGEAQRLKLASELAKPTSNHTLYVFDEPTTGLHPHDVTQLLKALDALIQRGDSVVVVEHHLDVIQHCDWLIDLGPGSGPRGGRIVGVGTPDELANLPESITGRYLRERQSRRQSRPVSSVVKGPSTQRR